MFNLFKKDKKDDYKEKENYQSIHNVVKAHYEDFLSHNGMDKSIKRAGVSFPEKLYEFLKIFSKYEQITVSKLVIDMLLYVLEDKERFNNFLKEKYGKKL
jgi:hypothetical protein